jgi:hypothetical protein
VHIEKMFIAFLYDILSTHIYLMFTHNAGGKELADLWQPMSCRENGYEGFEFDSA